MSHPPVLITLDYLPEHGGVARYLGEFVLASGNAIDVVVESDHDLNGPGRSVIPRRFFRMGRPKWWPIVGVAREFKHAPYLIVSHTLPVGTAAMISKYMGGAPYVLICHGLDVKMATRNWWKRLLFQHICKNAYAVISVSEMTKKLILDAAPGVKIDVLTPAVTDRPRPSRSDARKALGIQENEIVLLSVARLVKRKGIDTLLESAKQIGHQNIRFVIAGYGPEEPMLQSLARDVPHRVDFVKEPSDDRVLAWYAAADLFVLPVRESERDVEGYGIVFLEAALARLPVIAGKTGGILEAVKDGVTGVLVEPDNTIELAKTIESLLDDPDLRRRMGEAARDRVLKDFRWEDRWKRFQEIVSGL